MGEKPSEFKNKITIKKDVQLDLLSCPNLFKNRYVQLEIEKSVQIVKNCGKKEVGISLGLLPESLP